MNSIFSSFDALSAEFLGQAIRPSFASTTNSTNKETENMKKKQEGNVEKKKKQQQQRVARFAPDLDGLNCFETFVSC